jgi:hypothetical protein
LAPLSHGRPDQRVQFRRAARLFDPKAARHERHVATGDNRTMRLGRGGAISRSKANSDAASAARTGAAAERGLPPLVRRAPAARHSAAVSGRSRTAVQPHDQHREDDGQDQASAVTMQDVPGEEPGAERATDTDERGHADAHRVWTGKQQPCQATHDKADEEQNDEVGDEAHSFIVRPGRDGRVSFRARGRRDRPPARASCPPRRRAPSRSAPPGSPGALSPGASRDDREC